MEEENVNVYNLDWLSGLNERHLLTMTSLTTDKPQEHELDREYIKNLMTSSSAPRDTWASEYNHLSQLVSERTHFGTIVRPEDHHHGRAWPAIKKELDCLSVLKTRSTPRSGRNLFPTRRNLRQLWLHLYR